METLTQLGINLVLCLAGLIGYSLWSVRSYIHPSVFDKEIFWNHNKIFWVWAGACQFLYACLMAYLPELETLLAERIIASVKALLNQEFEISEKLTKTVVYLLLTWQLARLVNKSVKKSDKIGKEKVHINEDR